MKKFTTRLRSLTALWLVAVMLVTLFSFSASAENLNTVTFLIGDETITANTDIERLDYDDFLTTEVDFDKPLNQDDDMDDITDGVGGDLVGWTIWYNMGSDSFHEKSMDLAADVKLGDLVEAELIEFFGASTSSPFPFDSLLFVPKFDIKYWFTRQPTEDFPAVDTNKPADSYQWYKAEYADFEVVDDNVSSLAPNQTVVSYSYDGSYNETTGVWEAEDNGYYALDASVTMNLGDTLTITVSDGFDGKVVKYSNSDVFTKNGNAYTYFHTGMSTDFNFYLYGATADFTATITLNKVTDYTPVQGQTGKLYTGEGLALCKASFENGKYVLSSDSVIPGEYHILQQPSDEDPTVKVNKPEDVKGYQWYSVKDNTGKHILSPDDNEAGLKIKVTSIPSVEKMLDLIQQFNSEEELLASGINFALGEYKGNGVWAPVLHDPNDPNDTDRSSLMLLNAFGGGKFTVDLQVSDELQAAIDSDNNLSLEDIYALEILPISIKSLNGASTPTPVTPDANGVYTIPEDADVISIQFDTYKEGLTLKPVYDTTAPQYTPVDGQTKATFDGEAGKYLVKVTMKNDTVLTSDTVLITEKIVDTGDTTSYALWLTIFALCGVAFVFSVSKLRKA